MVSPDANGNRELLPQTVPALLKLNLSGVIGTGDLTCENFRNLLLDSREGVFSHDRVRGILLYINTPGGTVVDADGIYQALMEYKQKHRIPVYAFVDGMCASGGMYVACAADKIYAATSSLIGSVGVILGPTFNFSGLMEKYGVQSLTLSQGKDKDALNSFRPWQPGEDASLRNITAELYERFVSIVSAARPLLTKEKLVNEYGAQVYLAQRALEYGYIDMTDATYEVAVGGLAKAAQIPEEQAYQVMTLSPVRPLLADLAQSRFSLLQGKITHSFQLSSSMTSELSGKFLYLYQPAMKID